MGLFLGSLLCFMDLCICFYAQNIVYISIYVCMGVCVLGMFICIWECISMYTYVCVCVHMYVCVCENIQGRGNSLQKIMLYSGNLAQFSFLLLLVHIYIYLCLAGSAWNVAFSSELFPT